MKRMPTARLKAEATKSRAKAQSIWFPFRTATFNESKDLVNEENANSQIEGRSNEKQSEALNFTKVSSGRQTLVRERRTETKYF